MLINGIYTNKKNTDWQIVENGIKVYKGTNPEVDSYSVFWDNKKLSDTTLCGQLKLKGVTDIYVCGLAYDVCVGECFNLIINNKSFMKRKLFKHYDCLLKNMKICLLYLIMFCYVMFQVLQHWIAFQLVTARY